MSKTALWDSVSKTSPKHVKKVNQGARSFSAIDPYYKIRKATETFGPMGEGWGYDGHTTVHETGSGSVVIAHLDLWWMQGEQRCKFGPVHGCCELTGTRRSGQAFVDTDAPKKAMTDALTKGLSYLGFSADVFFGKFDDNKYVQDLIREEKQQTQPAAQRPAAPQPTPADAASDGPPPWFSETVGFTKEFKTTTWGQMVQGSADGKRRKCLEWIANELDPYHDPQGQPTDPRWVPKNEERRDRARYCLEYLKQFDAPVSF